MDYTNFRSSVGGFRRSDVFAYIEKTSQEHRLAVRELEKEIAALKQERDELRAQLDTMQAALPAEAPAAEAMESEELAAYRRAEAVERSARERADAQEQATRQKVERFDEAVGAILTDTQCQLYDLDQDTQDALCALQEQLDAFRALLARSETLLQSASDRARDLADQMDLEEEDA